MNFYELSQAMAPFSIFCLFYFFYRLNKMEKVLLFYTESMDKEKEKLLKNQQMMIGTIDSLQEKIMQMDKDRDINRENVKEMDKHREEV